jgi:hypothetical protein
MSKQAETAAEALCAMLEEENAALAAMDLARAAGMLGRKQEAFAALAGSAVPRATALRLRDAALRNRALLERGIAVQGQVIATVASAMRASCAGPVRYSGGAQLAAARGGAAFSVRA